MKKLFSLDNVNNVIANIVATVGADILVRNIHYYTANPVSNLYGENSLGFVTCKNCVFIKTLSSCNILLRCIIYKYIIMVV